MDSSWLADPVGLLEAAAACPARTLSIRAPRVPIDVLSHDPDVVRAVFRAAAHDEAPAADNDILLPVVGPDSVLTLRGERHRAARTRTRAAVAALDDVTAMHRIAVQRLPWRADGEHRLLPQLHRLSLDILLAQIFGGLADETRDVLADLLLTDVLTRGPEPAPPWLHLARRLPELESTLARICSGHRPRVPAEQLVTLFVTGHETVAVAAAWCLRLLATNPPAQDRVATSLSLAALAVREALRLRPVIPVVTRTLTGPVRTGPGVLAPGTRLGLSAWSVQHDPAHHPRPQCFDPARFETAVPPPQLYFPFGGGDRRCLGAGYAVSATTAMVHAVTARFVVTAPPEARPARRSIMLVPADDLPVRLRYR